MLKKIGYIIGTTILILLITVFTLYNTIQRRINEYYYQLVSEANDGNFDNFLRYQTNYHQLAFVEENENYQILFYVTISHVEPLSAQYLIIIRPLKNIKIAEKPNDENDQTRAYITYNGEIYDSKHLKHYGNFPISYGLNKNRFYYYSNINLKQTDTHNITLYDYNDIVIYQKTIENSVDLSIESIENNFVRGFTTRETIQLIGKDSNYLVIVYVVFGVLVAFAILGGVYYFKKWNLDKKQEEGN